jgi:MFS transporter, ACS family, hexuronate transporter
MHNPSLADAPAPTTTSRYQITLVLLLALNFGIVFFDRNALNFLMPYVKADLKLSYEQTGLFQSALSLTWALAAFGVGWLADKTGNRKLILILSTIAFSVCSFLSGIASSFLFLLGARLLMGVAEGGVMPISHAMVATQISPERRGLAQGVAQNLGSNLLGSFAAPVLLTSFAAAYGWREAFFLAGIPGLISAALLWFVIKEDKTPTAKVATLKEDKGSFMDALKIPNVLLCVLMGILLVGYLVICWVFMPQYLSEITKVSAGTNSWLMGTLGISATIGSFVIAGLSDKIGRRPVMIAMPLISLLLPLGVMFWTGPSWVLFPIFFIGWGVNGIFPLFMATVPSESVDPRYAATAMGLCMGASELVGGVFGPWFAGMAADAAGLNAPMWIMTGLALVSALLAFGLRETAPSQIGKRR